MDAVARSRPRKWRWVVGLVVVLGACSDDGLTPSQDVENAAGSTSGQETGSVNTSATVTVTASGDGASTAGSPSADTGGESTGPDQEDDEGTTGGSGTGESLDTDEPPGDSSGGDEPPCVDTDDCVCDPGQVVCEVVPPACPPGTVPEVDPASMCWTFACVPADACQTVPDCMSCGPDQACVVLSEPMALSYVCEPIPAACMDVPGCDCMPDACPMAYTCVGAPPKGGADLGCVCEVCQQGEGGQ